MAVEPLDDRRVVLADPLPREAFAGDRAAEDVLVAMRPTLRESHTCPSGNTPSHALSCGDFSLRPTARVGNDTVADERPLSCVRKRSAEAMSVEGDDEAWPAGVDAAVDSER